MGNLKGTATRTGWPSGGRYRSDRTETFDWSKTPLGSADTWSSELRQAVAEHVGADLDDAGSARSDAFFARLAHELRNHLSPMLIGVQLLGRKLAGTSEARQLEIVERQVKTVCKVVDDLLDVTRLGRGKIELERQAVDLRTAVERAIAGAKRAIESRRHTVKLTLPDSPVIVDGDLARLEQIVSHLVGNAAKYTDPGGNIDVRMEDANGTVRLRVSDNGSGIAPEEQERLFQSSHGQGTTQGGLGIGLALVRGLTELHGGSVELETSSSGTGSTFLVTLPSATRAANPDTKRVLIVDDNEDAASALADFVSESGYAVQIAHDGEAALAACEVFEPQLVFLDIGLPRMNGYEIAARLRERKTVPRLVALTGYSGGSEIERARAAGFDEHLVKPASFAALERVLRSVA